jgi:predicted RNA-binding protein with PIN domain
MHVIIDGYNLIHQSHTLDSRNIQDARDRLVDTLAAYKRIKGHKITVVFDGSNAPVNTYSRNRRKGIYITFSNRDELADAVIMRMVARERQKALVVSSDREILDYAASRGAGTISSALFEEKVSMTAVEPMEEAPVEDPVGWIPTTKKKGPKRRLPKRERRNRMKIRKL